MSHGKEYSFGHFGSAVPPYVSSQFLANPSLLGKSLEAVQAPLCNKQNTGVSSTPPLTKPQTPASYRLLQRKATPSPPHLAHLQSSCPRSSIAEPWEWGIVENGMKKPLQLVTHRHSGGWETSIIPLSCCQFSLRLIFSLLYPEVTFLCCSDIDQWFKWWWW